MALAGAFWLVDVHGSCSRPLTGTLAKQQRRCWEQHTQRDWMQALADTFAWLPAAALGFVWLSTPNEYDMGQALQLATSFFGAQVGWVPGNHLGECYYGACLSD
jgi:hypothetical protein